MILGMTLDEANKIYGQHNEGCMCDVCRAVEKWNNEHREDCQPEYTRESRFA